LRRGRRGRHPGYTGKSEKRQVDFRGKESNRERSLFQQGTSILAFGGKQFKKSA